MLWLWAAISSVTAQLAMEYAENQILNNLDFQILFYKRYVDDCLLAIPKGKEQQILNAFNSFHQKLQFTIEIENNKQINFLDVTLITKNNKIYTKWYTKTMFSGRYLNYNSEHHKIHKNNVITAIIDRAIKLTSPCYRNETINKAKNLLLKNNYPQHLINRIAKKEFMYSTTPYLLKRTNKHRTINPQNTFQYHMLVNYQKELKEYLNSTT